MKTNTIYIVLVTISIVMFGSITSCKKFKENDNPVINFKQDAGYTFTNYTFNSGDTVKVGIIALGEEGKDPLVKFNISKSVNDDLDVSVYNEDINADKYEYDFIFTVDSSSLGNSEKYTFTATNRDGLIGQKSLTFKIE